MPGTATVVLRTELKLFARESASIFWIIVFPPLLIGILGLVPDFRKIDPDTGISTLSLYVPVTFIVAALFAAVTSMPAVVATYREQRILRRMSTTPARPGDLLRAEYVIHGGAALLGGALALTVAKVFYGVGLPANMLGFVLVVALVMAAVLAIGGLVSSLVPTAKLASTVGTMATFPLLFTAGLWLPVSVMPDLLAAVVEWTPLGAGALALDATVAGGWPSVGQVLVVSAWAVATGTLAARYFRWE